MHKSAILALIISVGGMIASLWVSDHAFEQIPYLEDELAYSYQAQLFAHGDVYLDQPDADLRRMFWKPFVINCTADQQEEYDIDCRGKLFGKYPPGWPAVLTVGYWMGTAWVINPLIFLVSIALTYRLAGEMFDRRVGVIAALLFATSPIAWIQSGSFMSHSLAMLLVLIFFFALWRLESKPHWLWGIVGGVAIGWLFATRPSAAVSVVAPLAVYSVFRVILAVVTAWRPRQLVWWLRMILLLGMVGITTVGSVWAVNQLRNPDEKNFPNWPVWPVVVVGALIALQIVWFILRNPITRRLNPPLTSRGWRGTLFPLVGLGVMAIGFGSTHFAFNWATTGDPTQNLYVLVWPYDRIGFGDGHGRSGHSWERAKRNLNWDTDCYARDLFGWVQQPDNAPAAPVTGNRCAVGEHSGMSWIFLPIVLVLAWRRRWVWLMATAIAVLFFGTMFYWINAGDYSARYYYEATALLAILSAVGVVALADLLRPLRLQYAVYAAVFVLASSTVVGYGPDRVEIIANLTQFHRQQLDAVEALRTNPDQDVLIISYGEYETWRELSVFMALTSPYLDGEYVLARDRYDSEHDRLLEMFPNREVIYQTNGQFTRIYHDEAVEQSEDLVPVGGR